MSSALALQTKGLGARLRAAMESSMALMSCSTLWKIPRRMRSPVILAIQRSAWLSQALLTGVKWR